MRVAVVQLSSTDDVGVNLAAATKWIAAAAEQGAALVALPENFAFLRAEGSPIPCAQPIEGEIVGTLRDTSRRHGLWLVGGTFHEAIPGDERVSNTSVAIAPSGDVVAVYRKIHLFDVDLRAQGGRAYRESERVAPGAEIVHFDTPFGGVGLSVCYDVRFPELYRALVARGVRFLCVPAAFARETGRDHWEVLLRARAIENQCYVLAPAQCGEHPGGRLTYGRSMIVDPWGLVLARAADHPGVVVADCPPEPQDRIRATLPALQHRRLG
jgi:predicted amidohydrolase